MRTNKFFASMTDKALALAAAVMMMSVAFTACSSHDDDMPTPQPEPTFTNTVTLDGEKVPVKSVKYEKLSERFTLYLYLSENKEKDNVIIGGYIAKHLNKDIDLTETETGVVSLMTPWEVECRRGGKRLFDAYSMPPSSGGLVFNSGKLRINGNPEDGDEITIRLTNGKITDVEYGDGKEHTISIDWMGKPNF